MRAILSSDGSARERNDYYPFDARHSRSDYPQLAQNRYKYNGKESQQNWGLPFLDYGARMPDPALGRWFVSDTLSRSITGRVRITIV